MRRPLIAGNWKMNNDFNKGLEEAQKMGKFVETIDDDRDVMICVPYTSLYTLTENMKEFKIDICSQNMFYEDKGAYTGEISPTMLLDIGVNNVLLGHSERRQYFGETDEIVNKKILKAEEKNMNFILCVGETLEQRESGIERNVIKEQLTEDLAGLSEKSAEKMVIAYEPIWAIGTGKTATSDQANDMIGFIRSVVKSLYGEIVSNNMRILYGGSVKPNNVAEIMEKSDIDGVLVGGASLYADDFDKIIDFK